MIRDLVFIIDVSTSMCRKMTEVKKIIEQEILTLLSKDINRITLVEVCSRWDFIFRQAMPEEFSYKFRPFGMFEPNSGGRFVDCLMPVLLDLKEDMHDSDGTKVVIIADEAIGSLGVSLNFEDSVKLLKELGWEYITPLGKFSNGFQFYPGVVTQPWIGQTTGQIQTTDGTGWSDITINWNKS